MTKIFGANWLSTLWGWITVGAAAIALTPQSVAFLPDTLENYVKGICGLIAVVSGGAFAVVVKSRNVTGGVVQQTVDGAIASLTAQIDSSSVQDTKTAMPQK